MTSDVQERLEIPVNKQDDPLLTPKETAKELKVSESFLAKARMRGTGPAFIQIGRAVRYSRSSLEAYKALQTSQQQMLSRLAPRTYRQVSSNHEKVTRE